MDGFTAAMHHARVVAMAATLTSSSFPACLMRGSHILHVRGADLRGPAGLVSHLRKWEDLLHKLLLRSLFFGIRARKIQFGRRITAFVFKQLITVHLWCIHWWLIC